MFQETIINSEVGLPSDISPGNGDIDNDNSSKHKKRVGFGINPEILSKLNVIKLRNDNVLVPELELESIIDKHESEVTLYNIAQKPIETPKDVVAGPTRPAEAEIEEDEGVVVDMRKLPEEVGGVEITPGFNHAAILAQRSKLNSVKVKEKSKPAEDTLLSDLALKISARAAASVQNGQSDSVSIDELLKIRAEAARQTTIEENVQQKPVVKLVRRPSYVGTQPSKPTVEKTELELILDRRNKLNEGLEKVDSEPRAVAAAAGLQLVKKSPPVPTKPKQKATPAVEDAAPATVQAPLTSFEPVNVILGPNFSRGSHVAETTSNSPLTTLGVAAVIEITNGDDSVFETEDFDFPPPPASFYEDEESYPEPADVSFPSKVFGSFSSEGEPSIYTEDQGQMVVGDSLQEIVKKQEKDDDPVQTISDGPFSATFHNNPSKRQPHLLRHRPQHRLYLHSVPV